jgi:nucleoside-diphosphate-sugar epimerase
MNAIVGASGFVGSVLASLIDANHFTSANINSLADCALDTVWIAAPSAVKWKANAEPEADFVSVQALHAAVMAAAPRRIVHFSTVDVYGSAQLADGPDESTAPEPDCAYGANRLWLEKNWVAEQVQIVRLPGLFGQGLKKNIIFDLINNRNHQGVSLSSCYQWYYMADMLNLIDELNAADSGTYNVSVEPVETLDMVEQIFPNAKALCLGNSTVRYDMRSRDGYRFSKNSIIKQIREYAAACSSV